jgi:hypothetical protein
MRIYKSKRVLLVVTIIFIIATFLLTFIITGCGRRARVIAALEKAGQTEEQNGQTQTETVKENEKSDTEETVKESTKVEESAENEGNNTAESQESVEDEETTADEETTVSESVEETNEVETTELNAKIAEDMPFVRAECANIIGGVVYVDPVIYPGDNGAENLEVRGFISYDISQLSGATIESAKISGQSASVSGTPIVTYGPMFIKAVYWGARAVSNGDFNLDGIEITNNSKNNFSKSPAVLKDDLQNAVNNGVNRYQLCFYFEMPQTDGDGEGDSIQYYLEDISLTVTYSK